MVKIKNLKKGCYYYDKRCSRVLIYNGIHNKNDYFKYIFDCLNFKECATHFNLYCESMVNNEIIEISETDAKILMM